MKYKALFLDFYGTLVAEDDVPTAQIVKTIAAASSNSKDAYNIGREWYAEYQRCTAESYGESFRTQRTINIETIDYILKKYQAVLDAEALSQSQFTYWGAPEIFEDGDWMVKTNTLPTCIVSNIDTGDLHLALQSAGWHFDHILTSEACRSYKPRPELFTAALEKMHVKPSEVLHVGDSFVNDVMGAGQLGIDTAWLNRKGKALPDGGKPTYVVSDFRELMAAIGFSA